MASKISYYTHTRYLISIGFITFNFLHSLAFQLLLTSRDKSNIDNEAATEITVASFSTCFINSCVCLNS